MFLVVNFHVRNKNPFEKIGPPTFNYVVIFKLPYVRPTVPVINISIWKKVVKACARNFHTVHVNF